MSHAEAPDPDQRDTFPAELSELGIEAVVAEVSERLLTAVAATERMRELLEAVVSVGAGLDLRATLDRIVRTAADLAGARYSALGVVDPERDGLAEMITHGIEEPDIRFLDELVKPPQPLRLADLTREAGSHGFPEHAPPMHSFLGVPIRVGDEIFGNLYLTEKRGEEGFTEEDQQMVMVLAAAAGVAVGNARLYEATRQRERWINGSAAVTTALLSPVGSDDALTVVAEQARQLARAAAGIVLLPTEFGGMEVVAASGAAAEGAIGTVMEAGSPVVEQLRGGAPVFIADASSDERMALHLAERFGATMMLPLRSGGRVVGTLALPRGRGERPFTDVERALAAQFAAQAALALLLADAQRDRERLAVYEDRDRIARDLHDLVIQRLFATGMMLEGAQRGDASALPERISHAVDELDATIQEVRTAIFALQQGPADAPAGLRTRVLREIGTAAVSIGHQPSIAFLGAVDTLVSELTAKNLVAVLREALSNAARHSGASTIDVLVDATAQLADGTAAVRLAVSDDGVGITEGGRRSGLDNLSRRAQELGGASSFGPGPDGRGTRLVWEAPL